MSAFKIHDPEPGWQKRWPKDAFRLLVGTPEAFAIFLFLMPIAGAMSWFLRNSGLPEALYYPVNHFLTTTFGIIAVMLMCKAFYRRDGYASAPVNVSSLKLPLTMNLLVSSIMGMFSALSSAIGSSGDRGMTILSFAQSTLLGHMDFFGFMITFMIGLWYSAPVLAAGGMPNEENMRISTLIGEKIEKLIPLYPVTMILSVMFVFLVLGPLALFTGSFFVALIYVITKELYGGPDLKEDERKTVPNGVSSGA